MLPVCAVQITMCTFKARRKGLFAHQADSAEVGSASSPLAVPLPSLVLPGVVAAMQAGLKMPNDATAASLLCLDAPKTTHMTMSAAQCLIRRAGRAQPTLSEAHEAMLLPSPRPGR